MARRWVVSNGSNALEIHSAKVAIGGVVKNISVASCAMSGVVRQFFPTTPGTADARIKWTTTALDVTESVIDPYDASAKIIFNALLGTYSYDDYPNADGNGTFINPVPDGANQYLIRVHQVSGTALTGTLETWIDLTSASLHEWSLDETVVGTLSAVAEISISQDDGLGAPVSTTTVTKTVTFSSEVRVSNTINWSTLQRDLVEIKQSEDADCILTFAPDGYAIGDADTSGAFNESWHYSSPALANPEAYTVYATVVSGSTPTGSVLDTLLTLDVLREWTLLATTGENLSCSLDVTIDDLVPVGAGITKRITMNSERTAASATPVWTTTLWSLSDVAFPQELAILIDYTITFPVAGDATGSCVNSNGGGVQYTEAWLPLGETASDYEARIIAISGSVALISHTLGTWYNLGTEQAFIIQGTTTSNLRTSVVQVSVRKIGDLSVDKYVEIIRAADNGGIAP